MNAAAADDAARGAASAGAPLAAVPPPPARRVALRVTAAAARALRDGSPWVYADGVARASFAAPPGTVAVAFDPEERFVAAGLYDPDGGIVLRALTTTAGTTLDAAFLAARIGESVRRRADVVAAGHTGLRLVYGESDGLGGLVVDRYGDTLVVKLYASAWVPHLKDVVAALVAETGADRVVLRLARRVAERPDRLHGLADGAVLHGPSLAGPVRFVENGITFEADVVRGQKTGFFLDQRDNRARVGRLAAGRRVLNVCAYTGGFSLAAAAGGAPAVDSLDVSGPALADAERNFALNAANPRIAACVHRTLKGDAFDLLPALAAEGRAYDLVVLDPPAFAKRAAEVDGALAAYRRLTRAGLAVLAPGGVLVACSCSSRVSAAAFFETVRSAAVDAGRTLRERERAFHPEDHPAPRPEFAYLKALFADVA